MCKSRIKTTFILLAILTGCAGHTDTSDVSHNQDSVQVEQMAYQESSYHETFVEEAFTYEIWDADTEPYAVITGLTDDSHEYDGYYYGYNRWEDGWWVHIPETLGNIPVKEIAPYAFENMEILTATISATVERIGEGSFQGNQGLYKVLFSRDDCIIEKDAFVGCAKTLYFCYEGASEEHENLVKGYAEENDFLAIENFFYIEIDQEPVVHYYEEPLHLNPRVEDFFYGEYADDENFLSMEYAEDATDFGWREWHAPCGEFCVGSMESNMTASSTLASSDDRYAVSNLRRLTRNDKWDKGVAWAEGVEGPGIGEYITYDTRKSWHDMSYISSWGMISKNGFAKDAYGYPYDGYMRYLEVCIVNGYAKNEQTWEENGRVKTLLMYVEDRPYAYLELEDIYKPQYFELPEGDILAADGGEISFRFEIVDVYPGTKYEDTCLTGLELEFSGRSGH